MKNNYRWLLDNPNDSIQGYLANNMFFDLEGLEYMSQFLNPNSVVLEIGSNIGNHAVYLSKEIEVKSIYVIEPIPRSYKLLLANIALNYCHNVNVDFIGVGLGSFNCTGYPYLRDGINNLGAATISPEPLNVHIDNKLEPVNIVTGDSLFGDINFDFIKIDVEGMELEVLKGLKETINRCKPKMYVEVMGYNERDFDIWVDENDYKRIATFPDCDFFNIMIAPI